MNLRPSGYEPDELPGCSTPRHLRLGSRRVIGWPGPADRIVSSLGVNGVECLRLAGLAATDSPVS